MATNPYTSQTISGYNSSPPPDDGSQVASNEITWAKHKDKLGDPVKTLAEAIDTAVVAFGNSTINTGADEDNQMTGALAFGESELTLATGSITVTRSTHNVDTEADASTDDLDTISTASVSDGAILILRANNAGRTIVVKHEAGGAGQIHLADAIDISLDDTEKRVFLQRQSADWYELKSASGTIVQVVTAVKTDTFTTTSTSFTNVTGVAATIIPRSANDTIIVMMSGVGSVDNTNADVFFEIDRGGTAVQVGDAAGSRIQATAGFGHGGGTEAGYASNFTIIREDSPGTTSSTTYQLQMAVETGTGAINRTVTDTDSAAFARYSTQVVLMEIRG